MYESTTPPTYVLYLERVVYVCVCVRVHIIRTWSRYGGAAVSASEANVARTSSEIVADLENKTHTLTGSIQTAIHSVR